MIRRCAARCTPVSTRLSFRSLSPQDAQSLNRLKNSLRIEDRWLCCAPLREQLLRKDRQATAALLEGNRRIELAAELKGQEANAWERASEEVRAIDAKYAQARIAFLLHLRTHTWEPLK
jgi:hypothetical protein